jgi:hypothetical protein
MKSVTGLVELACNGLGIINAANEDEKYLMRSRPINLYL